MVCPNFFIIMSGNLDTSVQFSSLLTLSYTAHQYNKYKQYTRTGRLTGECGRSVHTMISTSNLH